jgi:hypothetical protein
MASPDEITITVAVPLHASARWVDNVEQNVRALPPMVTEIILSDRTCVDDAAEQLRERLVDDPRVTVMAEPAGLEWEEHHQLLLEHATGDLFMWMPHDDIFEASWIPTLARELEAHPQAWLAFGRVIPVMEDATTPHPARQPLLAGETRELVGREAARLAFKGDVWIAFRGLFHRSRVLESGIRLERAPNVPVSDHYWVLRVALRSALVFSAETSTKKRFYSGSTSPNWKTPTRGSGHRETLAVLRAYGPPGSRGFAMRMEARGHSAVRFARRPFRSHPVN